MKTEITKLIDAASNLLENAQFVGDGFVGTCEDDCNALSTAIDDATLAARQHEEILAGLANERPHSRFRSAEGHSIEWTYSGQRCVMIDRKQDVDAIAKRIIETSLKVSEVCL